MKITHEQIVKIVSENPNDSTLGSTIRELVIKANNINEVKIDPNQISLLDSINEVTKSKDGHRY